MSFPQTRAPRLRGARALFTARDGTSGMGGNLALHVPLDAGQSVAVQTARSALAAELGAPVRFVQQVHSADVLVVDGPAPSHGPSQVADAMVTDRRDVALAVMVADCLPVLLVDPEAGVVAAAHAGRRGLLDGVLQNTVRAMADLGAVPERVCAAVGPSACGSCYEVPEAMRTESGRIIPEVEGTTSWGTPALDLRAGARAVLCGEGLAPHRIDDEYPCTIEDPRFFSYRRERDTGRFAGVIRCDTP
ncbi:MAG: peptidoglycan editing factor PgeF [Brachybacterium sp.]|nr:peptidoglycan editing factor PgeF [Brachybacterium sp.]